MPLIKTTLATLIAITLITFIYRNATVVCETAIRNIIGV